jgi:hypothetical protein
MPPEWPQGRCHGMARHELHPCLNFFCTGQPSGGPRCVARLKMCDCRNVETGMGEGRQLRLRPVPRRTTVVVLDTQEFARCRDMPQGLEPSTMTSWTRPGINCLSTAPNVTIPVLRVSAATCVSLPCSHTSHTVLFSLNFRQLSEMRAWRLS